MELGATSVYKIKPAPFKLEREGKSSPARITLVYTISINKFTIQCHISGGFDLRRKLRCYIHPSLLRYVELRATSVYKSNICTIFKKNKEKEKSSTAWRRWFGFKHWFYSQTNLQVQYDISGGFNLRRKLRVNPTVGFMVGPLRFIVNLFSFCDTDDPFPPPSHSQACVFPH